MGAISHQDILCPDIINLKLLRSAKFPFKSSFEIQLNHPDLLMVEKVILLTPKRRLIAYGNWQGKSVFIKLFFCNKSAKADLEHEVKNYELLEKNNIKTPALLFKGKANH